MAGLPESPDAAHERARLQAAQERNIAQLAAVEAELAAARKAARIREVELLLEVRAKLLDTGAKLQDMGAMLHEKEVMQLALQVEAARRAALSSGGALCCKRSQRQRAGVCLTRARARIRPPLEVLAFFLSHVGGQNRLENAVGTVGLLW